MMSNEVNTLFVGAGPASLAGAIKLKQLLNKEGRSESVVVIDKANNPGQHNLSGAIFEADVLDELIPEWRRRQDKFIVKMLSNRVERDELRFLLGDSITIKVPEALVPASMHHKGDYIISISEMIGWLTEVARASGIEIYTSFAAKDIVIEGNSVKGIILGDKGLDKNRERQSNYLPREVIEAKVTVFGEGSLGLLSEQLIKKLKLGDGRNPQVYSLGIKELIRLPKENQFGPNRVIHTMGFPNKLFTPDIFGGGTLYSMGDNVIAVGLILALDWRYCDLNPQQELQVFKSHRFIRNLIEGGEVISYGAKTLPEGGYFSIPELVANGAMIIGDGAGLTNVRKLKGLHYAMKSGMLAAETIFRAIQNDSYSKQDLQKYIDILSDSFIMKDLARAKNYRQVFTKAGNAGIYLGVPLSFIQQWLSRLGTEPDAQGMRKSKLNRQYKDGIDRLTDVSFSGTDHREEEPSHIAFLDPVQCDSCRDNYGCNPCVSFCPGEVYRTEDDKMVLSPSNCLHCQTCRVKCPLQNIKWEIPEGGDGPRYKAM